MTGSRLLRYVLWRLLQAVPVILGCHRAVLPDAAARAR